MSISQSFRVCIPIWPCETETKKLCVPSSNLADMLNEEMTSIQCGGQMSRSQTTDMYMEINMMDTLETKLLCASSSNLADMLIVMRG